MCAKLLQSYLYLCDPMDCSLPGFSVHGILQARILKWVAMPSSRASSRPRDQTHIAYVSCIAGRFFTTEPHRKPQTKIANNYWAFLWRSCARHFIWSIFPNSWQLLYIIELLFAKSIYGRVRNWNSVQFLSRMWLFETLWTGAPQASLSITNFRSLLKLVSIKLVMPSNHLIHCRSLLLPPSVFPNIRVFSNKSVLHIRWPKYWSFSLSISPPMHIQDWFPLRLTGWISLWSKRLSRVFSNTIVQKYQYSSAQLSFREGNGTWLQYSCLENPMDRGTW